MIENKSNMTESVKTYGSGLLFAVLVGFSFLGLKTMVQFGNPLEVIAYRYTFAFIGLIICLAFKIVKVDFKGKPVLKKAAPTASLYVLFMIFQAAGLLFATSIESGIFFAIIPILVSIISSIFLKEKANIVQSVFMTISIISLIIMILCGATSLHLTAPGIIFLFLSSLCMAVNNVLMRYLRNDFTSIEMTTVIIIEGFIGPNLICIIWGLINGNLGEFFSHLSNPTFVAAGIYLGIPCTLISAALMAYMIRRVAAVKATIFGNLSTAISIVAGVLFLNEPLYFYHIACTMLIIVGVIGVSLGGSKQEKLNDRP